MTSLPNPLGRLRRAWRKLQPLLGPHLARLVVLTLLGVLSGLAEAAVLALIAEIGSAMVSGARSVPVTVGFASLHAGVATALLLALSLALFRMGLQVIVAWLPARLMADLLASMRRDLFAAYSGASWTLQSHEREGHLQEIMSNQTVQAGGAVLTLSQMLSGGAMFLAMLLSAVAISPVVSAAVLLAAAGLSYALRPFSRWGGRAAAALSQASMDQSFGVNESVRLAEEAQVFGVGPGVRVRIEELIEAVRAPTFRSSFSGRAIASLYQGLVFIMIVGGLAALYASGSGRFASLGAAVLILVRAATYGQQVQGASAQLIQALPYVDLLQSSIHRYRQEAPSAGSRPLAAISSLSLRNVSFTYPDTAQGVKDVTLAVEPGETIGVIGPSGAGKSTLVQLLLRLRFPDSGDYLVNGEPAQEYGTFDWNQRVAYLPQEPQLLRASVADNIRFFRDLDDEAVERAARLAHVHSDVLAMSNGYETVIGQRGDAVSGGQRQRVCLARALAGRPDVLVLDEPTSALDLPSERAVQESLAQLAGKVTVFIVAHRLSTLAHCDRVLVLNGGRVEALAPLTELGASSDFYRRAQLITTLS